MRLENTEVNNIKACIHHFDIQADVYLFGSRTDDKQKGGDIDLLIISNQIDFAEKLKLKICLKEKLGEQKIDIVTTPDTKTPFSQLVLETAIKL
jgi:predicted nucleotidyltransferase